VKLGSERVGFFLAGADKQVEFMVGVESGVAGAWRVSMPSGLPSSAILDVLQVVPDAKGPQRVCSGSDGVCRVIGANGETIAKLGSRGGAIVLPIAARLKSAELPSLLSIDPKGSLQCFRSAKPGETPKRVWSRQAMGCWSYYTPNSRP